MTQSKILEELFDKKILKIIKLFLVKDGFKYQAFILSFMLYMVGLGLADEKDVSVKGLEIIKKCKHLYLESYTSKLQCDISKLEGLYGQKIIIADRDLVEKKADEMLDKAKDSDVGFLVIGDPMCATTHIDLRLRAKEKGIGVRVIHNSSIISAIGAIGLEVYKFGKITSIPFFYENVNTPIEVFNMNREKGLHSLFLLDLDPINDKFLSIKEASEYLISKGISGEEFAIGCARIGSDDCVIKAAKLSDLGSKDYGNAPYCIVIPGKMHFMEEDALELWKD
jgi:diphthine synthase